MSLQYEAWLYTSVGMLGSARHRKSSSCERSLCHLCRYAWECQTQEGGWGLDWVLREHSWKLRGIVNGIDTNDWSPGRDTFLQSDGYRNYDTGSLRDGKAACKAALQRVRTKWRLQGCCDSDQGCLAAIESAC